MSPGLLPEELVPTVSARCAPPPPTSLRGRGRLCPQENGSARQASLVSCQGPRAQSSRTQHLSIQKPKPRYPPTPTPTSTATKLSIFPHPQGVCP